VDYIDQGKTSLSDGQDVVSDGLTATMPGRRKDPGRIDRFLPSILLEEQLKGRCVHEITLVLEILSP
jgi:hypothetical protein